MSKVIKLHSITAGQARIHPKDHLMYIPFLDDTHDAILSITRNSCIHFIKYLTVSIKMNSL